jgi:hypothetical protein
MDRAVETAKSRHTGRVSKLTPELQKLFFDTLRLTGFQRRAAMRCGVEAKTVCLWKTKGRQQKNGIYREFVESFDKFKAERIAAGAELHYRVSHGQIFKSPRRKWLTTRRGDMIALDEIELDKNGQPIMVDTCTGPDLRAIEWELVRLDPETYALKRRGTTVNNKNEMRVRPSLVDVLAAIGDIPEDLTRRALMERISNRLKS